MRLTIERIGSEIEMTREVGTVSRQTVRAPITEADEVFRAVVEALAYMLSKPDTVADTFAQSGANNDVLQYMTTLAEVPK